MVTPDADDRAGSLEHLVGPALDLPDRLIDVEGVAGDVARVGALQEGERLHLVDRMELWPEHPGGLADRAGTEAGAGAVAHAGVERDPEDRHVASIEVASSGSRTNVEGPAYLGTTVPLTGWTVGSPFEMSRPPWMAARGC